MGSHCGAKGGEGTVTPALGLWVSSISLFPTPCFLYTWSCYRSIVSLGGKGGLTFAERGFRGPTASLAGGRRLRPGPSLALPAALCPASAALTLARWVHFPL